VLAHFSVAFAAFVLAIILGEWQMFVRSPLHAWVNNPEHYYRSVTMHGTAMAYVLPTLIAMGFGYAITELALKRPLIGVRWAWGRLLAGYRRHVDGLYARGAWQSVCPLYILPADDWQPVLLFGCRAGRRRLMDMGRVDVDQSARLEDGQSR
jgi:hypothetical protein